MGILKRQNEIIELLQSNKSMSVGALAQALHIGPASIRRDLTKLERLGHVKRTHGGATLISGLDSEIPLNVREETRIGEKRKIAKMALRLINDKDIVFLDSSTTTYQLARLLSANQAIKVITNGAKTAITLGEKNIPVYSTGGKLREFSYSFVGDTAKTFMQNFHGNILFFSCRHVCGDLVLYDPSEHEAELRKVMMQTCDKTVLLCDSSKFHHKSFYKICDFSDIDYLVTDQKPDDQLMAAIKDFGCEVIWYED